MNSKPLTSEPESRARRLKWLLGVFGTLAVPVMLLYWPGCRQYPEVSSKESLSMMKLLYTACNTRNTDKLSKVEQEIENLSRRGKVTIGEKNSFRQIIARAKSGDWQEAERASLRFAQDQVR